MILDLNLKLIEQHQHKYPSVMSKYNEGTYHTCSFPGVSHIDINLIACEDNIVITSIIQSCILHWYHTYLLHPGIDRMEAVIFKHLHWPVIINGV